MSELKIGQKIYVDSAYYISHGSDDVDGGLATVTRIEESASAGKKCLFVSAAEHPGHSYNWTQYLSEEQEQLKNEFGKRKAKACPDIDRPWIEEGDIVDGIAEKIDKECDEKLKRLQEKNGRVTREFVDSTNKYIDEYLRRIGCDKNGRRVK